MISLIIATLTSLRHICKRARFKFITILMALMMCSDLSLAILSVCFYFEGHVDDHDRNLGLTFTLGTFTFFFNFSNLSLHWLFVMKYWMVSFEVPKLFE